jgi:hypothetical protein
MSWNPSSYPYPYGGYPNNYQYNQPVSYPQYTQPVTGRVVGSRCLGPSKVQPPPMMTMPVMTMPMQQQQQQKPAQNSRNVETMGNLPVGDSIASNYKGGDLKGKVTMISGCKDEQTSADVSNTAAFGIPTNAGPGGAGGACTNALLKVVHQEGTEMATQGKISYGTLLVKMKEVLKGRYTQIPQLSSGQKISTSEPWVLKSSNSRRNKALFIGINYVGTEHKLDGCHNDAIKMKKHAIDVWGFSSSNCKILMDDGRSTKPTRANIIAAMKWLVEGVRAGDSLFLHYSGHGSRTKDLNGDEESGFDSTMCPCDCDTAGMILDDDIFALVAAPIPRGAELFALMDCCHSGTILDLPHNLVCDQAAEAKMSQGLPVDSKPNPNYFNKGRLLAMAAAGGKGLLKDGAKGCLAGICGAAF